MAFVATKGSWQVQNLRGVMKSFKDVESDEARAWMSNRDVENEKTPGAVKRPRLTEIQRADKKDKLEKTKLAKNST